MIKTFLIKQKINRTGERGLWVGYIRQNYKNSEKIIDKLIKSGKYEKVKKDNPMEKPFILSGMVWAIVKKEA